MLVVKRKQGEGIKIGDDIEITIVKLEDNTVKIAIEAPKDIKILRSELYKEILEENKRALESTIELLNALKDKN
ncbi:MAG TPA: carbon storage regulator [Clostridium sp.]|jgi:carbon storage regulator|uniref:carbon storage regulator CsrA n=1 Tax=unclassified Clostridium TaxID=2614128 RepID=UPI000EBA88F7|nr:carbon storage regulator [Clostridium sp.]